MKQIIQIMRISFPKTVHKHDTAKYRMYWANKPKL